MSAPEDSDLRDQIATLLPRLRRFARTVTRHREDADDLVQVAVERALRRLDLRDARAVAARRAACRHHGAAGVEQLLIANGDLPGLESRARGGRKHGHGKRDRDAERQRMISIRHVVWKTSRVG